METLKKKVFLVHKWEIIREKVLFYLIVQILTLEARA